MSSVKNDMNPTPCCQAFQKGIKGFFGGREWQKAAIIGISALVVTILMVASIIEGSLIVTHVVSHAPMFYGITVLVSGALSLAIIGSVDIALLVNAIISAKRAIKGEPETQFIGKMWDTCRRAHAS